jgi:hypothetical protein
MFTSALETLKDCKPSAPWKGRIPSNRFRHLSMSFDIAELSESVLNREDLFTICNNPSRSTVECVASICAWGGMKVGHGKALFAARDAWLPIAEELRIVQYSRIELYLKFFQLRAAGNLPGCGPAFFTKFIFFMTYGQTGYIMNQWTAKSIHLLTGSPLPILSKSGYVTDENTGLEYENFCQTIELLGQELDIAPESTEEKIFSSGGKKAGQWRRFVKENWRQSISSSNSKNIAT